MCKSQLLPSVSCKFLMYSFTRGVKSTQGQRACSAGALVSLQDHRLGTRALCNQTDLACFQVVPGPLFTGLSPGRTCKSCLEARLRHRGMCVVDLGHVHWSVHGHSAPLWCLAGGGPAHVRGWPSWRHVSFCTPALCSSRQTHYLNGWHAHRQRVRDCI